MLLIQRSGSCIQSSLSCLGLKGPLHAFPLYYEIYLVLFVTYYVFMRFLKFVNIIHFAAYHISWNTFLQNTFYYCLSWSYFLITWYVLIIFLNFIPGSKHISILIFGCWLVETWEEAYCSNMSHSIGRFAWRI